MSLSRIDRVSANAGRLLATECVSVSLAADMVDEAVRVAVAIENAVAVALRPKEKFPDGESDVQPEAHGVAEDDE